MRHPRRWLTKDHPDPDRFHLEILARVSRLFLKPNDFGMSFSPLVDAFARCLGGCAADFALLWDFASLHQRPRTDAQTVLFKQGLDALPMWYGHAESVVWQQPSLPDGFAERMRARGLAETYETSGWCFVESSVSAGVKLGGRRLDLGKRTELALENAYGGSLLDETRLDRVCSAARNAPLLPDRVTELLRTEKKFTNDADVDMVAALYRAYFEGVTAGARRLNFHRLQWGDTEAAQLGAVLPHFASLTALDIGHNHFGLAGWTSVFNALRDSPNIKISTWDLSGEGIGPAIAEPLSEYISVAGGLTSVSCRTRTTLFRFPNISLS